VIELLKDGRPFTRENLEATYVRRRRESWVEREGRVAENARNGFHHGVVTGLVGMALAGLSGGRWSIGPADTKAATEDVPGYEQYYRGRIGTAEIEAIRRDCAARGLGVHDALMERAGWPKPRTSSRRSPG
jgi:electron-transferring-flavoprotein dehydrogenase